MSLKEERLGILQSRRPDFLVYISKSAMYRENWRTSALHMILSTGLSPSWYRTQEALNVLVGANKTVEGMAKVLVERPHIFFAVEELLRRTVPTTKDEVRAVRLEVKKWAVAFLGFSYVAFSPLFSDAF